MHEHEPVHSLQKALTSSPSIDETFRLNLFLCYGTYLIFTMCVRERGKEEGSHTVLISSHIFSPRIWIKSLENKKCITNVKFFTTLAFFFVPPAVLFLLNLGRFKLACC
uniref:Transmembrane protein n=1 Tax=Micrurus paraensis TaxID=1970185 RepID=A0A2D4KMM1_9SAUR